MEPIYREGLGDESGRVITVDHGRLEYRFAPGFTCELVNFDVEEGWRSKGIGTTLMQELEKTAKAAGLKTLYGFTACHNVRARKFYRTYGFSLTICQDFYGPDMDAYLVLKIL